MKHIKLFFLFFIFLVVFNGCGGAPATFIQTMEPGWATIELRDDVDYNQAWMSIYDLLVRTFDIEIAQKDNGYLRSGWIYTWSAGYADVYRVRVTVKFPENRKSVNVKSEAFYKDIVGYDTRLLSTLKTDIMGSVGRTTR